MLVLTRKRGELIQIDGNILVTVISVQGNRVRLGIEAPPNVLVLRDELKPLTLPIAEKPVRELKKAA